MTLNKLIHFILTQVSQKNIITKLLPKSEYKAILTKKEIQHTNKLLFSTYTGARR